MKLEQEFFVGAHDVDRDKKVTNKALLEMLSDISMLHGVKSGQTRTEGLSPVLSRFMLPASTFIMVVSIHVLGSTIAA